MGREARSASPRIVQLCAIGAVVATACGLDVVGRSSTGSDDVQSADAGGDASKIDGSADTTDAAVNADASGCPAVCADCIRGTCRIECPGPACTGGALTCPAGMNCRVQCTTGDACEKKTIECPPGGICVVECASGACDNTTIKAATAAGLCLECDGNGENPGCNSLTCETPPTCGKVCSGGSCNSIQTCGDCADVFFCP